MVNLQTGNSVTLKRSEHHQWGGSSFSASPGLQSAVLSYYLPGVPIWLLWYDFKHSSAKQTIVGFGIHAALPPPAAVIVEVSFS